LVDLLRYQGKDHTFLYYFADGKPQDSVIELMTKAGFREIIGEGGRWWVRPPGITEKDVNKLAEWFSERQKRYVVPEWIKGRSLESIKMILFEKLGIGG